MPAAQFQIMKKIIEAPSPIGYEGAMTYGVLKPYFDSFKLKGWGCHQFKSNSGIVFDTAPDDKKALSIMVVGHADKIRLQVRSIGDDGKVWVNSDSFLPTTLIGHYVKLFVRDPKKPGKFKVIKGGTVEAIGAIHFADPKLRSGTGGIKADQLYLELQLHGPDRKKQVEKMGIRVGDPLLLDRPLSKGIADNTFIGPYLDNGLGCFVTAEIAKLIAKSGGLKKVRYLGAMATHEEIGRFGSRIQVQELRPDILIAVDVNHDYAAAPGIGGERRPQNTMGAGFTIDHGAVTSIFLNDRIDAIARKHRIPLQDDVVGRDTGTDGMAAALAGIDSASASIGFPIRNMHTISECAHTGDVLAAIHVIYELIKDLDKAKFTKKNLKDSHLSL
ncbi:MAG: peptidase M42 [Lentisphaeria bacterium]|nr:peptidase M42 [Lentisphaeria bacterium]